jgi:hypothetical protein
MRQTYQLFLNGEFYGSGDLRYMNELISDYVVTCRLYGKDEVDFKVVKKK